MGKRIQLNERQLKRIISESVKNAIYNFASSEPQFDMNSDEYAQNYDSMRDAVRSREKENDDALMDLQIAHHNGKKGKGGFKGDLKKGSKEFKKGEAMSEGTIETEVMKALNAGKSPEEITNLKPFSPQEMRYIKDDCAGWLEPVGSIDKIGKIVFYDMRKDKFVCFEDDREY